MSIHPKARPLISKLPLPGPIRKYFSHLEWEIDLSNNTNPHLEEIAYYPDVRQNELKKLYLNTLISLNPPAYFHETDKEALSPDNLLFTAGSMEGLDLVVRTFVEPKSDLVCVPTPSFSAYEHWALIHGVHVIRVPLLGKNLEKLNLEDIYNVNPKLIFVCNPNNPTGTLLRPEIIPALCENLDGIVVVDEAYIEYSQHPSSLFYLKRYSNLIVLRTFSKAWGLAGARCGAIISNPSIIHTLRHVQLPFSFSSLAQEKVRERLLQPERAISSWEMNKTNRTEFVSKLSNLSSVSRVFRSETNFVMCVVQNLKMTLKTLEENGIQVLDCSDVFANSIRVSLGTPQQNEAFLEVMAKISSGETKVPSI